jgi:hypothetical protein
MLPPWGTGFMAEVCESDFSRFYSSRVTGAERRIAGQRIGAVVFAADKNSEASLRFPFYKYNI